MRAEDLAVPDAGLDGMCLYGSDIYDCVADAVQAALIDLKRETMASHVKRRAPVGRKNKP
jgi:hypothetical protein